MKDKLLPRLLVLVPPRRALPGRATLASGTVVGCIVPGEARSALTPIALLPRAASVDLVFDMADVFVTAVDAPRMADSKLRLALPNLLEERLLSDAADCHFAFSPVRATGGSALAAAPRLPVAVIDRGLLTRALDALAEAGYRVRAAYSELYLVPAPPAGVLSLRVDHGRAVARSAPHEGFAFELEPDNTVPPALALAVRQLGIQRIVVWGAEAARVVALAAALGVTVDDRHASLDPAAADGAVNLLQGPFASGGMLGALGARGIKAASFKWPLIWAGIAAAVMIAGLNLYWLKLDNESKALRAQMENAFRSTFPETTAVVDPVLQTRRQLSDLRARAGVASADDFSVLNARAAQLLAAAPLGAVAGLEYREGTLKVKFKPGTMDNPGLQNALRAAAVQQGLSLRFEADGSARIGAAT